MAGMTKEQEEQMKKDLDDIEIKEYKALLFVEHIEQHLKDKKIKGKVICKICNKTIDDIYKEARERQMKMKAKYKKLKVLK